MSPLIVDKEEKKRKILQAASDIFVEKGFSNVVISDIAQAAGIGKGTVYEYFKSKEELFSELLAFLFEHHQQYTPQAWGKNATPEEKLKDLLSSYIRFYVQASSKRNKVLFMLVDYLSHNKSKPFPKRKRFFTGYRKEIRSIIEEGVRCGTFRKVDVGSVVIAITMTIDGLMFQMFLFPQTFSVEKIGSILIDMVLGYLKVK